MAQWHRGHPTHLKYHYQSCSDETTEAKTSPCSNPWCLKKDKQKQAVTHAEEFGCSMRKFAEADSNSMKTLVPPRVLSSYAYLYVCTCAYACIKLAKPFFEKKFWILVLISMVVNWKDMFSKQWEQTFLMWQLFTVNSWNNSAVLHRNEKVRAPWTGSLGSTRQSAFTHHPCRQFQLFYTNQQVYISSSAWPPLKCWSALSLSWVFCYPDKAPLFHLQG